VNDMVDFLRLAAVRASTDDAMLARFVDVNSFTDSRHVGHALAEIPLETIERRALPWHGADMRELDAIAMQGRQLAGDDDVEVPGSPERSRVFVDTRELIWLLGHSPGYHAPQRDGRLFVMLPGVPCEPTPSATL
jgi:hypothetical protein